MVGRILRMVRILCMLPEPRSINLIVSSPGHFGFVTNAAARATFVSNAVKMIEDYGFDGM